MALASPYRPSYARALVYMLQSTEYQAGQYLRWFWRTQDFDQVMRRRDLRLTWPARLLLLALWTGMFLQFALGVALIVQWVWQGLDWGWQIGLALVLSYPFVWAHIIVLPLAVGRWLVVRPRQARAIRRAERIFANHPGKIIAVAGSYGKTSMKELLATVLAEGLTVAATPANKNVAISHARFASGLKGDEDALIIEYGEGRPGDVARFARNTHPKYAIITGLSPAHLDRYRTLERAAKDIFSVATAVGPEHTFVNTDSAEAVKYKDRHMKPYGHKGALGWKVSDIKINAEGTSFKLAKGGRKLTLDSGLLGRHNIGPLAFAAAFAAQLGLTDAQIEAGSAKTIPHEHRLQPRQMSGALILDDTYNGNLDGIRAGTSLLHELPAKRKWYVTPGLVDQGPLTAKVHHEIGQLIAGAQPDIVVLMENSVTNYIAAGLQVAGYQGEIRRVDDPLEFYTTLPHFVAAGDLVLMQNDWTDNYA